MGCHLGMADVQVAIRFRRESGHDLAASGFQVCLQLSCCVGNAHLTTSGFSAEGHHFVDLRAHTSPWKLPLTLDYSGLPCSNLVLLCVCKLCRGISEHVMLHCNMRTLVCVNVMIYFSGAPICKCVKMRNRKVGIPLRAELALSFSSGLGRCPYTSCEGVASSCTVCTAAAATPLAFSLAGAACKSITTPSFELRAAGLGGTRYDC